MKVFLTVFLLLGTAWLMHLLHWRLRLPARQIPCLLLHFGAVFIAGVVYGIARSFPLLELLHIALLYWSLALSYIITYSAIEGDSPTLMLVYLIARRGAEGFGREDVDDFARLRPFVQARLAALLRSGLVAERQGRYVLADRPSLAFRLVLGFRKLYGTLPKGG